MVPTSSSLSCVSRSRCASGDVGPGVQERCEVLNPDGGCAPRWRGRTGREVDGTGPVIPCIAEQHRAPRIRADNLVVSMFGDRARASSHVSSSSGAQRVIESPLNGRVIRLPPAQTPLPPIRCGSTPFNTSTSVVLVVAVAVVANIVETHTRCLGGEIFGRADFMTASMASCTEIILVSTSASILREYCTTALSHDR